MHTTTVRFDDDEWNDLNRECGRLRIAKAAYIRGAVRDRLAVDRNRGPLAALADALGQHAERVARIERTLERRRVRA